MAEPSAQLKQWQQCAEQAKSGELYLDSEEVARECLKACNTRLDDLDHLRELVLRVQNVSGFGDFEMAEQLRQKFLTQATGTDNSIDAVITDHIETVKNMREVMRLSISRITGQDVDNAGNIKNT
ncbi:hypothetical protein B7C42_05576 [Nocardia cerradoensis]|uniref:Uncharacterized protein n=1 Tax=Nocardia cerradoensis TaxID=85688 RepID=A0A231H0M5_9NOCA|nr:hypothetical protein [Nocardia cerradoensis]OXR42377.1 hypothetical protein B7C42_05576 [Nocardia cerradoensis]